MRKRWIVLGVVAAAAGALFVLNTSLLAAPPEGALKLLAHRGVHQRFSHEGLENDTCTAERIFAPTHAYLENTLPSIAAAYELGADMVEIDVHPTTDGEFAVFHDWTVDCRTEGEGPTRDHTMAELRALDVGYGYTADGGQTFPFRGQGVGMMPTLREVLAAFPDQGLLINFKSNDANEGDLMVAYLDATPNANLDRLAFIGARPAERVHALRPDWIVTGRGRLKACAKDYMLTGWFGATPETCRNTIVFAPINYAWVAWGWPNRFLQRMQNANTDVYIIAPLERGRPAGVNIDDAELFARIPKDWRGGVSTDAIEVIGPLAQER